MQLDILQMKIQKYMLFRNKIQNNTNVKSGCIVYSEDRIILSIDNKNDCRGINSEDYKDVKIGSSGIKAGDVSISSSGVSTSGVKVGKDGAKVSGEVLKGIQYIGEKID